MLSSRHVSELQWSSTKRRNRHRGGGGDAAAGACLRAAIAGPVERLEDRIIMSVTPVAAGETDLSIEPETWTLQPLVSEIDTVVVDSGETAPTPPTLRATDDYFELNEGGALPSIDILANDNIPTDGTLRVWDVALPDFAVGTWTWDPDRGLINFTPEADFNGLVFFNYYVNYMDVNGAMYDSNVATVKIKVNAVNDAPTIAPIGVAPTPEGSSLSFIATASDRRVNHEAWNSDILGETPALIAAAEAIEGTSLTFSLDGEPEGASIDPSTGQFHWPSAVAGAWTFDVVVTDNGTPQLSGRRSVTIQVFGDGPTVQIHGAPAAGVVEGAMVALTSAVTSADPSDTFTYAWSVTRNGATFDSGTDANFSFTATDDGIYAVRLTVTDDDGDEASAEVAIAATNAAPVVSIAGTPGSANEGDFIRLGGLVADAGTADTHAYHWTVTKDGMPYAEGGLPELVLTPDDNGAYVVTLTVTDDDGAASNTATTTVTVLNVAPTASIDDGPGSGSGGSPVLTAGELIQFVGSGLDPGLGDQLTFAWSVTKDGIVFAATGSGTTFAFTPTEGGAYRISFTVSDDDQASDVDAVSVLVVDAPIAVQVSSSPSAVVEGGSVTVSGIASGGRVSGGYTVTIDWGDGTLPTTLSTTGGSFSASHPYTDDNAADLYAIGVTVQDTTGASAATSLSASVTNADPVVTLGDAPAGALEGGDIVMSGAVTDAGTADTLTVSWSATKNGNPFASGTGTAISFKPDDNATYVVTLTATDDDGGAATATSTFSVGNAAPVVTLTSPVPGTNYVAGSVVNIAASFTDAGTADTHTVDLSVVTPDGVAVPVTATVDASGNVTANYTVTNRGVYEIVLTVTDDDGGTMTVRRYIAVDAAQQGSTEGFIAGGGWYYSDAGSNALSPTQTGKAHFAAVAWYEDGYDSPLGMLLFRVGTTTFRSSSFESLVVEGNKATLEGVGTLNGVAGYSFRVTVVDGSSTGSADEIRVEIRRADTGLIVYDSNMGEREDELTTLLGGNLKVTG